jgi:MoaA/NifB/PqqE/SkfB family radical SAM enzyme
MKATSTNLKLRSGSLVDSVVGELAEHPDMSSEEIAMQLGLSRDELLACYDAIRDNQEYQRNVIEKSVAPRFTQETSDLITRYDEYLTKILGGEEVFPLILEFHPGSICNSQCGFCFSHNWEYGEYLLGEDVIGEKDVLQAFAQCRQNGVEEVWFSGGKEPFINPRTPAYIRAANDLGLRTRVYTNGISLKKEARESVLDSYQIRISFSAATPGTYQKVQFPKRTEKQAEAIFYKVIDNIADLVRLKKERGKQIRIGMSQILQPLNHHEIVSFVELGKRLGVDSVHLRLEAMGMVRDFTEAEKQSMLSQITELRKDSIGIALDIRGVAEGEFESRQTQFLPKLRKPTLCRAGLLKRGMNPYGAIYNCEFSSHPRFRIDCAHCHLGNIREESIQDILRRAVKKFPATCQLCQAHEYGLNITLEKIQRDLDYGIPINRQPYYREAENNPQAVS